MAGGSANLKAGSIVIMPSLSGTTKESVAFLDHAARAGRHSRRTGRQRRNTDWPAARRHAFVNAAADDTSSESFYVQSLCVALSVMKQRGEGEDATALAAELPAVPEALLAMKRAFEPGAERLARVLAAKDWHIFTGAGNAWPEAFYFGMCILEEMQWIRTRPVHASDFFHGTLELVEPGVSVVASQGRGQRAAAGRAGGELRSQGRRRAHRHRHAGLPAPGLSPTMRALLAPAFLATVLERVAAHLEVLRDHPLTTRRYYRRVEY